MTKSLVMDVPRYTRAFTCGALVASPVGASAMTRERETTHCVSITTRGFKRLSVEVADNIGAQARGLNGRSAPCGGLLLVSPVAGRHPIWMVDMLFDLDLVRLNEWHEIVATMLHAARCLDTSPERCPFHEPSGSETASAVLELPAGQVTAFELQPGQRAIPVVAACESAATSV